METEELLDTPPIEDAPVETAEAEAEVVPEPAIDVEAIGRAWAESKGYIPAPQIAPNPAPAKQLSAYERAVEQVGNTYDAEAIQRTTYDIMERDNAARFAQIENMAQGPSIQQEMERQGVPKEILHRVEDAMNIARSIPGLPKAAQMDLARLFLKGAAADTGIPFTTPIKAATGVGAKTPKGADGGAPSSQTAVNLSVDQQRTVNLYRKTQGYTGTPTPAERSEWSELGLI